MAHRNGSYYQCCSGFCVDLLEKFAEELGFTYELVRVEDGKWGTLEHVGPGPLSAIITIHPCSALSFIHPCAATFQLDIPKPFDTASWMLVGVVAIHAATFTIFIFEWLSPSGFNMKCFQQQSTVAGAGHRFSLFRTYWLVWAVLFQAAVHVDSPRGFTSKFMTNMWAMFAVVFLAIYTANLAAFMITREEYHEFSGIDDNRLAHPYSHKPTFKFGTIPWSHSDSTLKKYFKEMHAYMRPFNRTTVTSGVEAVVNKTIEDMKRNSCKKQFEEEDNWSARNHTGELLASWKFRGSMADSPYKI
ncbi:unnamed protein product [Nezara viridula]|uniref:Uncharacterized protein n=1 Tax=Nezara viridula TaxID=85310 RepID=A0A9P0HCZ2_NEZVI|nr:unnamed protein product [Nezara viridula]